MHAQTGLAVQGKDFGMLSDVPTLARQPSKRTTQMKRKKSCSGEAKDHDLDVERGIPAERDASDPDAEQTVKLGPLRKPYLLCAKDSEAWALCLRVATHIWKHAEQALLKWPTKDEVIPFASQVVQFAKAARDYAEGGKAAGFLGGRDINHQYTVKSFTRGMLIVAETMDPTVLDVNTLERIQAFLPDQNNHTSPVSSWSGREIRRRFGMSVLMLSCWCCLAGWMDNYIASHGRFVSAIQ
jgi:hypothetical protein